MRNSLMVLLKKLRMGFLLTCKYSLLEPGRDVHIGRRVHIRPNSVKLGVKVFIGDECWLASKVEIGNCVMLAGRVAIVGGDHRFDIVGTTLIDGPRGKNMTVVVNDDVWIGFGCTILQGVTIGEGSIVGAGSVITKNVPPYSIVAGVPAKFIRSRFPDPDQIEEHRLEMQRLRDGLGL